MIDVQGPADKFTSLINGLTAEGTSFLLAVRDYPIQGFSSSHMIAGFIAAPSGDTAAL